MTCKQILLYQSGDLNPQEAEAFKKHLATCKACQARLALAQATEQSLTAPAAPAALIEKVLQKTTRRPSLFKRFRMVLAGSMTMVALAVGVGMYMHQQPATHAEFVAYMNQSNQTEYVTFAQDLDLLEQIY